MALLTMLKCGQARAGPEPRALVGELVEAVLGDAVEYREHAPVADGDRLVTHLRVLWNLRARDGCDHLCLIVSERERGGGENTRTTSRASAAAVAAVAAAAAAAAAAACCCFHTMQVVRGLRSQTPPSQRVDVSV